VSVGGGCVGVGVGCCVGGFGLCAGVASGRGLGLRFVWAVGLVVLGGCGGAGVGLVGRGVFGLVGVAWGWVGRVLVWGVCAWGWGVGVGWGWGFGVGGLCVGWCRVAVVLGGGGVGGWGCRWWGVWGVVWGGGGVVGGWLGGGVGVGGVWLLLGVGCGGGSWGVGVVVCVGVLGGLCWWCGVVVVERDANLGIGIDLAHRLYVLGTALLHHRQAFLHIVRQPGEGSGYDLAHGARALAAAEYQQTQRPIGLWHAIRCTPQGLDLGAQGISGEHDLGGVRRCEAGNGKSRGHHLDPVSSPSGWRGRPRHSVR